MNLSFFSCSRSALLYSIIIIGAFFLFGQIGITHAATPVPPTPVSPPSTYTSTIPSGSIMFQWSYSGDTTNIWFYLLLYKWDINQSQWTTVAGEYVKNNTYDNKFINDGYYAWQVAAVDITKSDPNNWYKWMNAWSVVHLLTPTPTPTPTPIPTKTPTPNPSSTPISNPCDDTGTAIAPCNPPNPPVKTVTVCASGCDYSTIQSAVNASAPGWIIQVKNGTYTSGGQNVPVVNISSKNCTQTSPCALMAYPGHHPVIDPRGDGQEYYTTSAQNGVYIEDSEWWIIDGFEIKGGWYGMRISHLIIGDTTKGHISIVRNVLHNNRYDGLHTDKYSDLYTAYNKAYEDGTDYRDCGMSCGGACGDVDTAHQAMATEGCAGAGCNANCTYRNSCFHNGYHCHPVYVSQAYGRNADNTTSYASISNITLRGNYFYNHIGNCLGHGDVTSLPIVNQLWENNVCLNNQFGLQFWGNQKGIVVRNNLIIATNLLPIPRTPLHTSSFNILAKIDPGYGTGVNQIYNNIFYATANSYNGQPLWAVYSSRASDATSNKFDYNLWKLAPGTDWYWYSGGVVQFHTDFNSDWQSTTGWDSRGVINDPLFVNIGALNFNLQSVSPARNKGDSTAQYCAKTDYAGTARPQESICDIGAYEYKP